MTLTLWIILIVLAWLLVGFLSCMLFETLIDGFDSWRESTIGELIILSAGGIFVFIAGCIGWLRESDTCNWKPFEKRIK